MVVACALRPLRGEQVIGAPSPKWTAINLSGPSGEPPTFRIINNYSFSVINQIRILLRF